MFIITFGVILSILKFEINLVTACGDLHVIVVIIWTCTLAPVCPSLHSMSAYPFIMIIVNFLHGTGSAHIHVT